MSKAHGIAAVVNPSVRRLLFSVVGRSLQCQYIITLRGKAVPFKNDPVPSYLSYSVQGRKKLLTDDKCMK